jgi:hypothetical protein
MMLAQHTAGNAMHWDLIMAQPNAAVQVEKRYNVVMKGLGGAVPGWNTKSLNQHFFHHLHN